MDSFEINHFWRWADNRFNGDTATAERMLRWVNIKLKSDPDLLYVGWLVLEKSFLESEK